MVHLDSDFCVDVLRNRRSAVQFLATLAAQEVAISTIVRAELHFGARRARDIECELAEVESVLAPFMSVPFDGHAAVEYGRIRAMLEITGTPIGHNDLFIAATALVHDATLITRNTREFIRIPGLRLKSWPD